MNDVPSKNFHFFFAFWKLKRITGLRASFDKPRLFFDAFFNNLNATLHDLISLCADCSFSLHVFYRSLLTSC